MSTLDFPTGIYDVNSEHVRGEGAYHWPRRWSGREWVNVPGYEGHTFRQAVRHAETNAAILFLLVADSLHAKAETARLVCGLSAEHERRWERRRTTLGWWLSTWGGR